MWVSCPSYVDQETLRKRLERKEYGFDEWYQIHFRIDYGLIVGAGSG